MSKLTSNQTKLAASLVRRIRTEWSLTVIIGLLVGLAIMAPLHPRARALSASVELASANQQGLTVTTQIQNNRIISKTHGAPTRMEFAPGEVLLSFKDPEDARLLLKSKALNSTLRLPSSANLNTVFQRFGVDDTSQPFAFTKSERLRYVLKLTSPLLKQDPEKTKQLVSALKNDPAIEYVELNLIMRTQTPPNDTYYSSSGAWGQSFRDLWGLQNINAETAWNTSNGANVIVAVSDTGVDYNHEDIAANIWTNAGETGLDGAGADKKSNGVDDDHNGFIDDWHGYDFVTFDNDPMDDHGHGTHVSGTIAAIGNNAKGIIGVAYGARIMPVKGLSSLGEGTTADLVQTILYAADNGAKVINASWSGFTTVPQQTFINAIAYAHDTKGAVFVAAAGNGAEDVGRQDFGFAPANIRNVVTVSAFDHDDHRASFSNFGQKIDVAAPGGGDTGPVISPSDSILSLLSSEQASFPSELIVGGKYLRISGTSMAAPHASGIAALILSLHPEFSPEQVRQALHLGTDDVDAAGFDINSGYGRSNAARALTVSSPLVAQLVAPATTIANTCSVNVQGSAAGAGFASWRLEFGEGTNPVSWTQIASSTTPVTNGLLTSWNTSSLGGPGLYTLRLIALNTGGQSFEDRLVVNFDDAVLTDPAFDFFTESGFTAGLPVAIKGTASGCTFSNYTIKIKRLSDNVMLTSPSLTLTNGGLQRVSNDVLGIWDTTNVPADHYELTLQVSHSNGTLLEETTRIIVDPTLHVGWPKNIGLVGSTSFFLAITDHLDAEDVNLDGYKELIVGYGDTVRLFDRTGNQLPGWPQSIDPQNEGYLLQRSPAVGDVDGDGVPEIVAASTVFSTGALKIFIWHADGSLLPGWPRAMNGSFDAVAIADLNGDGTREIVTTDWKGQVKVFNKDGQFLPGWPRAVGSGILSPPSIADLDGDGTKEIVVKGVSDGNLYVLTSTGTNLPGWPKGGFSSNFSYPALGDLNGDHRLEIVVTAGSFVVAFNFDGSHLAGWPQGTSLSNINSPAIGDIDGDGRAEVVVGGYVDGPSRSNSLYAWHGNGAPLPNWPVTVAATPFGQSYFGFGSPMLADVDGDNRADVIVSGDAGPVPLGMIAYNGNGTSVSGFPKPTIQQGGFGTNTAVVADLDNDGLLELAWLDIMANLFVWDLQSPADTNLPWPMFHHDAQHTGANPLATKGGALQFSSATFSVAEDGVNANVTVTRSGDAAGEARVNYATSNGTATAGQDYTGTSGTLTFPDGITSQSFNVAITNDVLHEPDETINLTLTSPAGSGSLGAPASAVLTINDNDPQGGTIAFASPTFTVTEIAGSILIVVNRQGDMTEAVTVDYATADVTADGRKDYTPARGTLHFDAGVSARAFPVLVNIDAFAEGSELVELTLTNPTGGAALGVPATATLQIDNTAWSSPPANSIDHAESFVRQHYHDFLNRDAGNDPNGLAFWTNQITECQQPGATCDAELRRINVSAAFYLSIEFQETGYLVERIYKASYGDTTGTSTLGGTHQLAVPVVRFNEFLPDTQTIGLGVVVGQPGWEVVLENNKQAFTAEFVQRTRFATAYQTSMTPTQFVDALFANAGVTPSATERNAVINEFGPVGNTADSAARARALRRVAENSTLKQEEKTKAFVLMQYFGYLRRNPNEVPDSDHTGYDFWLGKLNGFNGNFVAAEMVKAFLVAGEYRHRFGP